MERMVEKEKLLSYKEDRNKKHNLLQMMFLQFHFFFYSVLNFIFFHFLFDEILHSKGFGQENVP
jgi:hypothetical protein